MKVFICVVQLRETTVTIGDHTQKGFITQPGQLSKLKRVFHTYEPMIQEMEDEERNKIQMHTKPTKESDTE